MANPDHLDIFKQGVKSWNLWRKKHPDIQPDLSGASLAELSSTNLGGIDLSGADLTVASLYRVKLSGADLSDANLEGANLEGANLTRANLTRANFTRADLFHADLSGANLNEANLNEANLNEANLSELNLSGLDFSEASLSGANLSNANLSNANLSNAELRKAKLNDAVLRGAKFINVDLSRLDLSRLDLSSTDLRGANLIKANLSNTNLAEAKLNGANLSEAILIGTNLTKATLIDCLIFGISAWNVQLEEATQLNLVITPQNESAITVDNLKIAQFIYLLLNNEEIREVIDTITSKVVLILGRFTPERKRVLDALRDELRKKNYLPIVFDFQKPANRDLTETVSTLAHMARFVIADITDPKSIPQELKSIVPNLPSVVVQPLLHARSKEYGMFEHFKSFPWVLEAYRYTTVDRLLVSLKEHVIEPAEQKAQELSKR